MVSDTLSPEDVEGWGETRRVTRRAAHAEIAALKQKQGREIVIFGSHVARYAVGR